MELAFMGRRFPDLTSQHFDSTCIMFSIIVTLRLGRKCSYIIIPQDYMH